MGKKLHIAVNTRLLLPGKLEGISRFGYEVLKRMVENHPDARFSFFFDRKYDPDYIFGENVTPYVIPPQARHPLLWHAWFHFMVKRKMDQLKPDVLFSPEFYLTNHPSIPQIPVFHDIAFEHYPEDINPWAAKYCRKYGPIYAQRAKHIFTVSEFCRTDISEKYKIDPEKISVVYNAADQGFKPIGEKEQTKIREQYANGSPYFLFVGTVQPRKNLEHLLRGFDQFKSVSGSSDVKLLLTGRKGWKYEGALAAHEAMTHPDDVIFTGFVNDEELNALYASSLALCLVSYLEGFGIPLVEAMQAETAVITSNVTALPEVAGDAAILVDPFSVDEIAHAMLKIYHNPTERETLIDKGKLRREAFSWDQTSEIIWKEIEKWATQT
ncbi:MAG: glycosyltransferase family 4 protein [Bacteroidetes bacterium]|nr:glycosyltransferase family 4 protein [Bacteroidota bacterium]